jgi:cell division control protein 6
VSRNRDRGSAFGKRSRPAEDAITRSSGRARREPEVFRPSKMVKTLAPKKGAHRALESEQTPAITAPVADAKAFLPQASTGSEAAAVVEEKLILPFGSIMQNLHGAGNGGIVGREQEQRVIAQFLDSTVGMKQSGALYVSGRPGCGKTLSVRTAADAYKRKCKVVMLNGMSLVDGARDVFSEILKALCPAAIKEKLDAETCLRKMFTSGGDKRGTLLVLDELDALLESGCEQSVLAALFSWTQLAGSKLVVIGIANALDLTHRFLPILHAKNCAPKLLTFTPYSEQNLLSILRQRLRMDTTQPPAAHPTAPQDPKIPETLTAPSETLIKFDLAALDLCARRISAESGDTRKAMEACREAAKAAVRAAAAASSAAQSGGGGVVSVGMGVMAKTLSRLLVTNHKVSDQRLKDLPLHQALLLCVLVLRARGGCNANTEGELLSSYVRLCQRNSLSPLPANQLGEMRGALCDIGVAKVCTVAKRNKMYVLNIEDSVVQSSLEHVPVYQKILQASCL